MPSGDPVVSAFASGEIVPAGATFDVEEDIETPFKAEVAELPLSSEPLPHEDARNAANMEMSARARILSLFIFFSLEHVLKNCSFKSNV